ncbi:hypothetical protein SLITO_v1c00630 [Spiroplasma litorale]|uniref:Probable cell division protein WhiA n=1 Tax=Spiroplasma litorale TaxID=216942 RepID=A0A0K1W0L3_9MOLU|nr:DNA-binding protein WhiA [Spiroplasma litorale]AKX33731.1 hypothetical protein SLITO_v1c00630 [Spiroplasma litorale]
MSFALDVKNEILNHDFSLKQMKMLLTGFLKFNGEIIYNDNEVLYQISCNNNALVRGIYKILKQFYKEDFQTTIIDLPIKVKNKKLFRILLTKNVKDFLEDLKIYDFKNNKKIIEIEDVSGKNSFEKHQDLIRAYVSGVFIAVGSVNSPETPNYHLELQFKFENEAIYFLNLMHSFDFDFKIVTRRNNFVVYLKKSMLVSDFLKFIDAAESVMAFENTRIGRDLKNNVIRYINTQIHNQKNITKTGNRQIEEINLIINKGMLSKLSLKAQVLAKARLKNPETSFSELVQVLEGEGIKITKSGVSNLFKIISKLAKQIKEG